VEAGKVHGGYDVFLGLDVGKGDHHAVAMAPDGRRLHDAPLPNTEARLRQLFDKLAGHGGSIRGEHPPRGGNKNLKRAFFLAAFAALADPTSRAYYDRKRAEGKRHNAALICLARRRCDVLYAMLRDKIPYQPRPATPVTA
jgi:transposase